MLSKRLLKIASFVNKEDFILDVGTDHGYLPIFLIKNKLCKNAYASDISENALKNAKENIKKEKLTIKTFLTDGLENIPKDYDTLIISGMGTSTIIKILDKNDLPEKIILSSNNDLEKLRRYMNKINYNIKNEEIVLDKNKYYDVMCFSKGKEKLSYFKIKYGKSNDKKYYNYLYLKTKEIFKKSKKINLIKDIVYLKIKSI